MENLFDITKKLKDINIKENKAILDEFRYQIQKNENIIKEILTKENKALESNYQYDKIFEIIDRVKDYQFDKLNKYSSIGRVVCFSNGDTYFLVELMIKAILTKTKVVFVTESYMLNTNTYLISIIQKVLEKYNVLGYAVSLYNTQNYKEITKAVENIDCIVVNKNWDLYKQLQQLTDVKIIYSDYGNINVYAESDDFENEIKKLCEDASKEDKDVFLFKTDNIQAYIDNMDNNFLFYSVVIYTKDLENCTYFFRNIKAENVYINKNPFETNDVEFSEFEFLFKKNIIY